MPTRRALLAALLLPSLAHAQPAEDAMRDAVRRAVAGHILPRHAAFAAAGRAFAEATAGVETPGAAEAAREAWTRAAVAFQGVRHLRFGPMDPFDRGFRIALFPDPRNVVSREMTELLRNPNPESMTAEVFARDRVGAQGLPAAERLLFGADAPRLLAPDGAPRRLLLAAIGRNIGELAAELESAWTRPEAPYGRALEGVAGGLHRDPQDGLLALFKSLHGGLEFLAERQVARAFGPSLRGAYPCRTEAWRSGVTLALIRASLEAMEELWRTGFAPLLETAEPTLGREVTGRFAALRAAAGRVAPGLEEAVAYPAGRDEVEALLREAGALRQQLTEAVAPAIGLPVGFNAMDGD